MSKPSLPGERALRVFVSSTFRDMQAERDELVKHVFPQVRRRCEERGVVWGEVDLRWGITSEQQAEGAVLPICLAEIDRTRPFFLGLLGERYGWVPDELPADLTGRIGWLADDAGRSVTELEILHGVLRDPEAAGHAFFYLRDPAFVETLPAERRGDFVEGPTAAEVERLGPEAADAAASARRQRLAELKAAIRASGHPVREYPDPRALGALVLDDLLDLVDRLFPEREPPDPAQVADARHDAFGTALLRGCVERSALVAALDAAAAPAGGVSVLVHGPPGAGASALATGWARAWHDHHPDDVVIVHHTGADADAADVFAMVRRMVRNLSERAGDGTRDDFPDDTVAARVALATAFGRVTAAGRRAVVVVDGADALERCDDGPLGWLRPDPPAGVTVVVTGSQRLADAASARGWTLVAVPPLTVDERRAAVDAFLSLYTKALDRPLVDRLATAATTGNARYLRVLLDELRQFGEHFELAAEIDRHLAAPSTADLLALVLARYERDFDRDRPNLVADTFRALWAARRGLSHAELTELLGGPDGPLPGALWSPLFLAAEAGVVQAGGLLRPASAEHRAAIEARYLPDEASRRAAHARLAAYFGTQPLGPRAADELPWQHLRAGDAAAAARALAVPEVLERGARVSYPDVRRMWHEIETEGVPALATYRDVVDAPGEHVDAAWLVARLLTDLGHLDSAIAAHRGIVEHYARASDDDPRGPARHRAALLNLGDALHARGDLDDAAAVFADLAARSAREDDPIVHEAALGNLAVVRRDLGDLDGALAALAEQEPLTREIGDDSDLQALYGNRAGVLHLLGDLDGALAEIAEQERLCRATGDELGVARALTARATVLADRGDLDGALAATERFEAHCRELGDVRGLADVVTNRAAMLQQLGRLDDATAAAAEAVALRTRLGDGAGLARARNVQAAVAVQRADWPGAERAAREAEGAARSSGADVQVAVALGWLGVARREQGDVGSARTLHAEEEQLQRRFGSPRGVAHALTNRANADLVAGDVAGALARYAEAESLWRDAGATTDLLPLLHNRAQAYAATGRIDDAVTDLDNRAAIARAGGLAAEETASLALLVQLLYGAGRQPAAAPYLPRMADAARRAGDDANLQLALGEDALTALGVGDLDRAERLLAEQEQVCRRSGHTVGLAQCVGNQAILLRHRNDFAGSLAKLEEQDRLCRANGDGYGVIVATANRGEVLSLLGRTAEAIAALEQARDMAADPRLAAMRAEIERMIAALRR